VSRRSRLAIGGLAFFSVTLIVFGITDMVGGVLSDPGITVGIVGLTPAEVQAQDPAGYRLFDFTTRALGLALVVMGTLLTSILAVPYRGGQRWSWVVMWVLPAWAVSVPILYLAFGVAAGAPPAPPMLSGPFIAALAAAALVADRGRFAARPSADVALELGRAGAG
jgi:hypothetical protein